MNPQTLISRQWLIGVCIIRIIHKIFDEDLDYVEQISSLQQKGTRPEAIAAAPSVLPVLRRC